MAENENKSENKLLASPLMRTLVFAWLILFPILFIALPLAKVATGEGELTMTPIWAAGVWILGPLVWNIVRKYSG